MRFIRIKFIIILFFIACFTNCGNNRVANPAQLELYTKGVIQIYPIQNEKTIFVSNTKGGIIIVGWSVDDSIRVYLYKQIEATSRETADMHFGDMKGKISTTGDTLEVKIVTPENSDVINYKFCSLSIDIPINMNCTVQNSNGITMVNQLSSELIINESADDVQIEKHEGSCDVLSMKKINVQMILPDTCYCHLDSEGGDISLSIPDTTNSSVNLVTDEGTITYENLIFNQLIRNENTLNGILGTGEAEIDIHTDKGNIILSGL